MSATTSLRRRILRSLLPAGAGGLLGALYARASLPPAFFRDSSLPAMYGAAGAASAVLAVRLAAVLRMFFEEIRSRRARGEQRPVDEHEPPPRPPPQGPERPY